MLLDARDLMQTLETISSARDATRALRTGRSTIGFVPTMGALHDGHWSLIDRARAENDAVVVSIFVNPLQFGEGEDLDAYPRRLQDDLDGCRSHGVDMVFCPTPEQMYARPTCTRVSVRHLGDRLCGLNRPGHFDGVCTVVCKLLNIVAPDRAYFGEKDYQQLVIVSRMVAELNLPVEIVACPTVREAGGLAMSSRNAYLSESTRRQACGIHQALIRARDAIRDGATDARGLIESIQADLTQSGAESIDYVAIVDPGTLDDLLHVKGKARICVAARFEGTRLIDNISVDVADTYK